MSVTCQEMPSMAPNEARHAIVDWGENTAGSETGALKAGDTVSSCVIVLDSSPAGSTTPTIGSVTVNTSDTYINSRLCSAGEATSVLITMGATQATGQYRFKLTATTANAEVIPRYIRINVMGGG